VAENHHLGVKQFHLRWARGREASDGRLLVRAADQAEPEDALDQRAPLPHVGRRLRREARGEGAMLPDVVV
jgi:hypothetical protein